MHVRAVLGLVAVPFVASLLGCSASPKSDPFPGTFQERPVLGALPPDLPENPEPCVSYCSEVVPATYRMVPKLCEVAPGRTVEIQETVLEMRAREVCVKPRTERQIEACGTRCQQELVQVKPGGFRWVHDKDCGCWQYCEAPPEYTWCDKTVEESGIRYCVEQPPEFKTVVETVPVTRPRYEYVPPRYEVQYVRELYKPAERVWVPRCESGCMVDPRKASPVFSGGALDCGCPSTN